MRIVRLLRKISLCIIIIFTLLSQTDPMIFKAATSTPSASLEKTLYVGYKNQRIKLINTNDSAKITYSSKNKQIATVDKNGYVKPISKGKSTIVVKITQDNEVYTSNVPVKVSEPIIKVKNKTTTLMVGQEVKLKLKYVGLNKPKFSFISSNSKILKVNESSGLIKAIAPGNAKITITDTSNNYSISFQISVIKKSQQLLDILDKYNKALTKYLDLSKRINKTLYFGLYDVNLDSYPDLVLDGSIINSDVSGDYYLFGSDIAAPLYWSKEKNIIQVTNGKEWNYSMLMYCVLENHAFKFLYSESEFDPEWMNLDYILLESPYKVSQENIDNLLTIIIDHMK